ncbi:hypothetical protein [Polycladidibacter hongkongensis]|uniref:hypothetical protein n=1 Tax=Polycladidibacter hongkongensis TaxID=1647556 RepID=UPI000837932E|nr:hypothetical protein [Pseudovibrio hongkongensis]
MLRVLLVSALFGFVAVTTKAAPLPTKPEAEIEKQTAPAAQDALPNSALVTSSSFVVTAPVLTMYWSGLGESEQDKKQIVLPAGAKLVVLDWVSDERLGKLVRLGVDVEGNDAPDFPSDIFVANDKFEEFPMQADTDALSKGEENAMLGDEADSHLTALADTYASTRKRARVRRKKRGMTYCYRHVKNHLLKEDLVESYLPGGSAYMAKNTLPKHGFKRLNVKRPEDAPNGAICVYDRDKRNRHGHIEVKKKDNCFWYGYGCKANSMYGKRRFVDCYVKEGSALAKFTPRDANRPLKKQVF